jgi:hypothetical protein
MTVSADEAEVPREYPDGLSDKDGERLGVGGVTSLMVEVLPGKKVSGRAGNLVDNLWSSMSEGVDGGDVLCEYRLDRVGESEEP